MATLPIRIHTVPTPFLPALPYRAVFAPPRTAAPPVPTVHLPRAARRVLRELVAWIPVMVVLVPLATHAGSRAFVPQGWTEGLGEGAPEVLSMTGVPPARI